MRKKYLKLSGIILILISIAFVLPEESVTYADTSVISPIEEGVIADSGVITTKKQLIKVLIGHITNLNKNFSIKISYKVLNGNNKSFARLWTELTRYPEYNEIMEHTTITGSESYSYRSYFVWQIKASYSISKAKAEKLLKNVTPIVKTKKGLINALRKHIENLDKSFYINVNKKVLNINNKKAFDAFWNELYEIPEFNDISRYFKNFQSNQHSYNGYYKWIIKTRYKISKQELNYINTFVKNWVEENINDEMSDEEKVRAINDFMVTRYRYTFGDKGQCPKGSKNCPEEKLGKYSVYSTFSLLYGGGGVCDAKAKLFYRLAKEAGLKVLYITGYVNGDTLHAWNMVKVDGNWYHIDNTWNRATEPGMTEYEYFNTRDYYLKSDASMIKGHHTWKAGKYPRADFDYPLTEG